MFSVGFLSVNPVWKHTHRYTQKCLSHALSILSHNQVANQLIIPCSSFNFPYHLGSMASWCWGMLAPVHSEWGGKRWHDPFSEVTSRIQRWKVLTISLAQQLRTPVSLWRTWVWLSMPTLEGSRPPVVPTSWDQMPFSGPYRRPHTYAHLHIGRQNWHWYLWPDPASDLQFGVSQVT